VQLAALVLLCFDLLRTHGLVREHLLVRRACADGDGRRLMSIRDFLLRLGFWSIIAVLIPVFIIYVAIGVLRDFDGGSLRNSLFSSWGLCFLLLP
jgi:hypothetical protein